MDEKTKKKHVDDEVGLEWFDSRIAELIRNFRQMVNFMIHKDSDMKNLKEEEGYRQRN